MCYNTKKETFDMKKQLLLCIFVLCVAGCATTRYDYEFKVFSQNAEQGMPSHRQCKMNYMNADEKTIDGRVYTSQTEDLLKKKGISIINGNGEDTDCIISVAHETNFGKEQKIGYTYGQTGISSSTSTTNAYMSAYNMGNTTYGYGRATTNTTYNPTYGVTGAYTYDVAKSYITFAMSAKEEQTENEMWKIIVSHPGHIDNKFINVFPLFKCIISHYLFRNYDKSVFFSREELDQIFQGHCNLIEWPGEPTLATVTKEANKGDAERQFYLGNMYYYGQGTDPDHSQAFYWISKSAEQNFAPAQMALGNMYLHGIGTTKDDSKAFYWFLKAAEQGDMQAQVTVADMYHEGTGTAVDKKSSFFWMSKAAIQGNSDAQLFLAGMYYNGDGTKKDLEKAFEWSSKSAEQGNIYAQASVADMYYAGEGVKQNLEKAFEIYSRPAIKNDIKAEARLSCYDATISSLKQHFDKCLVMAKQGNSKAQYAVFSAYYNGFGTQKDTHKAYTWLEKAAQQDSKYQEILKETKDELSKTQ